MKAKNLKSFVNDESIASLFYFSSKLDYLISVDTGQVHICDILQVPSLVFIHEIVANRFGNSSYANVGGGLCYMINSYFKTVGKKSIEKHMQTFAKKPLLR